MGKNILLNGQTINNCSIIKIKDNETGQYIEYHNKLSLYDFLKGNYSKLTADDFGNATSIPDFYFYNNTKLKEVELGSNILQVGKQAFYNCSNLEKIIVPSSVCGLGVNCFYTGNPNTIIRFLSNNVSEMVSYMNTTYNGHNGFYEVFIDEHNNNQTPITLEVPAGSRDDFINNIPSGMSFITINEY